MLDTYFNANLDLKQNISNLMNYNKPELIDEKLKTYLTETKRFTLYVYCTSELVVTYFELRPNS